ncbi:hypothetical protein [Mesorhizobium sp. M0633]|uniref:hypothetical protein n=1 Tax=Mesorhizobium sp. M0633 TaxID=2956977 RepID=UPI00333952A7
MSLACSTSMAAASDLNELGWMSSASSPAEQRITFEGDDFLKFSANARAFADCQRVARAGAGRCLAARGEWNGNQPIPASVTADVQNGCGSSKFGCQETQGYGHRSQ